VLAVKPDPERARMLHDVLRQDREIDLEIVRDAEAAIRSMQRRRPHLVITPALLPPSEEARLNAFVRSMPGGSRLPIIEMPFFVATDEDRKRRATVLGFVRRGSTALRPHCDAQVVRDQIHEYLRQVQAHDAVLSERAAFVDAPGANREAVVPVAVNTSAAGAPRTILGPRDDRRRAPRKRAEDVPSLWSVKLPWESQAAIVDISSRGVLLQTTSKLERGAGVNLQFVGEDVQLTVPARAVRSEVADVTSRNVIYRVAAAFSRELDVVDLRPASRPALTAESLAGVLGRVLAQAERHTTYDASRAHLERELRRLLPVRDLQIRESPIVHAPGTESVYFSIPCGPCRPQILQAVFDAQCELSEMEFRILKASANIAAVVLQLAPASNLSAGRGRLSA
jgi:hypothetical protein